MKINEGITGEGDEGGEALRRGEAECWGNGPIRKAGLRGEKVNTAAGLADGGDAALQR